MKKIELLAPAGDLDSLKAALTYGADAVYIGGKSFSLRYFASNFTIDDINEGVEFAHKLKRKVYVACNMVMHNENLNGIKEYLIALKKIDVDAVIISSVYMLKIAREIGLNAHMSTQLSLLNSESVNMFYDLGSTRCVLGREASLENIQQIVKNSKAEIEVFIHGGMCSSLSGRCMLSYDMVGRDPNRGGCAHSCRWKYHLWDKEKQLFLDDDYFSMASKDLSLIEYIPALIEAGVSSLKIEGRMKSINYLAFVVSAYRKIIDDYFEGNLQDISHYSYYIERWENRSLGLGFILGDVSKDEMINRFQDELSYPSAFVGIIRGYDKENKKAILEVKNKIINNNRYFLFSPKHESKEIIINNLAYGNLLIDTETIAGRLVSFDFDGEIEEYDILHTL